MTSKMKLLIKSIFFAGAMFALPAYLALGIDNTPKELLACGGQCTAEAQLSLGEWYESRHNYGEAAKCYREAAGQGNVAAQFHLGSLYEHGQGVPEDYSEAAKWYMAAAEQGNFPARYGLGVLFANGQGVAKNMVQAGMWLDLYLAEAKNDREAITFRNELEKTMSPQQLEEARALAREWLQQHPGPKLDSK